MYLLKCFRDEKARNPGGVDQGLGEGVIHGPSNDQKMVKERMFTCLRGSVLRSISLHNFNLCILLLPHGAVSLQGSLKFHSVSSNAI